MSTLYQALGLPQGASEQQVKAAFRNLARRFHPDVNGSNAFAEQRFKELSLAYKTLMDPGARAAYDRALVCQQESVRRRFWKMSTTATATFTLTVSMASLAVLWSQQGALSSRPMRPQIPGTGSTTGAPKEQELQQTRPRVWATVDLLQARRRGSNWSTYRNANFRFALKYPADVFALEAETANVNGATLTSKDGQAKLRIFAAKNVTGMTIARYRRFLIKSRYAGVSLDHTLQGNLWFVLSGNQSDEVLYEHVAFSCDGRSLHGWQMIYPSSERTFYDLVADEIHRSSMASTRCDATKANSRQQSPRSRTGRP